MKLKSVRWRSIVDPDDEVIRSGALNRWRWLVVLAIVVHKMAVTMVPCMVRSSIDVEIVRLLVC